MSSKRNEKASQKLTAQQESALREATSDYQISIKYQSVKKTIADNPHLKSLTTEDLSNHIRNEKKKRKRKDVITQKPEQIQQMIQTASEPQKHQKLSDAASECYMASSIVLENHDGSVHDPIMTSQIQQQQPQNHDNSIPLMKAEEMFKVASTLKASNPLRKAIIQRIACPTETKAEELERLLRQHLAEKLAYRILDKANDNRIEIDTEELKPEIVTEAFCFLAECRDDKIQNQNLLQDYLIPAIKQIDKIHPMNSELEKSNAAKLAEIVLKYFNMNDTLTVPVQLYHLAHEGGAAHDCAYYLLDRPQKNSMKEFLKQLGFTPQMTDMIKRSAIKLFHSSILNELQAMNKKDQLSICNIYSLLIVKEDPKKYTNDIIMYVRKNTMLRELLDSRTDKIDLVPQDFLSVLKFLTMINKRESISEILTKDPSKWRDACLYEAVNNVFANSPAIFKRNFESVATSEGFQEQFDQAKKACKNLEKCCPGFIANTFQVFVAAKILYNEPRVTVARLRMGSGKSYIAALVAKCYLEQGKRVAVVVPQAFLATQLNKMLGQLRQSVKVTTMQDALISQDKYDVFVIDEADQCVLELGSTIDTAKQLVCGYWDILRKRSVLLTATISHNLEDILFQIYGFESKDQLNFDNYLSLDGACKAEISYQIERSDGSYWKAVQDTILEKSRQPIIVFFDSKKKIKELKPFCLKHNLPFFPAENDQQLLNVMSLIRQQDKGVVATLREYGRGADIRFKVDSFVLIGFLPLMFDSVLQMTGRASRTMGNHRSKLIAVHQTLPSEGVESHLKETNFYNMEDGIEVSTIMLGRRLMKEQKDTNLLKSFAKGWRMPVKKIRTTLGEKPICTYIDAVQSYSQKVKKEHV